MQQQNDWLVLLLQTNSMYQQLRLGLQQGVVDTMNTAAIVFHLLSYKLY
jgi:hypothetical protein